MELPVVATAVKGHEDLIIPGENGLLFPFGDAEACASQLRYLLDHADRAKAMGAAAGMAVKAYDLTCVLPQVTQAYLCVLGDE